MVMHELAPDDPDLLAGKPLQGPNQWPAELPGFRDAVLGYVAAVEQVARRLTAAIALAFDLDEHWFDPHFRRPTTWLRLLHYPPLPDPLPSDLYGSAPHTDYGFLTVLAQDDTGGLEVRARDGGWIPAPPLPGTFVVNVADMLMRWTNGILTSTPHRVRNVSGRDRYSVPFFFDPSMDTLIEALPTCVPAGSAPKYEPVHYGGLSDGRIDRSLPQGRSSMIGARKIIIDTDPGQDNAFAILFALGSPADLDVVALTTVGGGNVPLTLTSPTTRFESPSWRAVPTCRSMPAARGRWSKPLKTAEYVHGPTGIDGVTLPQPKAKLRERHAEMITLVETLMAAPGGRVDHLHARADDQSRHGDGDGAENHPAHPRGGADGRRLLPGRQHHACGRVQHLRRPARGQRRS